ncbi:MAG: hypothetical protein QOG67_2078 [Verrucomicrobiota bacterium]
MRVGPPVRLPESGTGATLVYCTVCGKKNLESSNFCEFCGARRISVANVPAAPAGAPGRALSGQLLIVCLLLMLVFPILVLKRSVGFYREAGPTAPESSLLSRIDEIAAERGNRNVARDWGRFDRSVSGYATACLALDLCMAVCSAWIGYNLFTRKRFAAVRALQFMLAMVVGAIVRDLLLPKVFDLELSGNKLSMSLFIISAVAGYVYLKRLKQVHVT